jgi:L-cysteine:1D-myo-inositol 2-amino-2-deoxy-alpha-D-glucopyranoside ligase
MSKSLGNLVFVRDLRQQYDPRAIRLALLAHHYHEGFEWFDGDIEDGVTRLARLDQAVSCPMGPDPAPTLAAVRAALDNDLDTASARDALDTLAIGLLAGAGDHPDAAAGLAQAAELLGIDLTHLAP